MTITGLAHKVSDNPPNDPTASEGLRLFQNGQTASWEQSVDCEDDCANRFPLP